MNLKERLVSTCSGIILNEVRKKGRLTFISDECGINRKYLIRGRVQLLRFHRLVKLLYATSSWMNRDRFTEMGAELFGEIWDFNNEYDDRFYSE